MQLINEISKRLKELKAKENNVLAEILFELNELDKTQGFRDLGYASLYVYCTEYLGYSEGATYRRIKAARFIATYPDALEKIKAGTLHLCAIVELSKVVNEENKDSLILMAEGNSKREVQREVAKLLPAEEPKRERIVPKKVAVLSDPLFSKPVLSSPPPLTEQRYSVSFEADEEFMELLTKARSFSGQVQTLGTIKKALKHFIGMKSPIERTKRRTIKNKRSRYIPVLNKDSVYVRDQGQCTFVSPDGKRCTECNNLQYDHIKPFALGGSHEVSNLRLRCFAHNQLAAERIFAHSS